MIFVSILHFALCTLHFSGPRHLLCHPVCGSFSLCRPQNRVLWRPSPRGWKKMNNQQHLWTPSSSSSSVSVDVPPQKVEFNLLGRNVMTFFMKKDALCLDLEPIIVLWYNTHAMRDMRKSYYHRFDPTYQSTTTRKTNRQHLWTPSPSSSPSSP